MNWRSFFEEHRVLLQDNYPGLTLERFLREAQEIGGDGSEFLKGTPFAYLLGYAEFAHIKLKVTPDVLIPRMETELLYEMVVKHIRETGSKKRLLDLGCGPGTIGLSIAHTFPQLKTTMSDISDTALTLAKENAQSLDLTNVNFIQSDLYESVTGLFDIIVTNPPYIPFSYAQTKVHKKTHEYEPQIALYVPDAQYIDFFFRLFIGASRHLIAGGMFFMEGHEDRLHDLVELAKSSHLQEIQLHKDLTGALRFMTAFAPYRPIG